MVVEGVRVGQPHRLEFDVEPSTGEHTLRVQGVAELMSTLSRLSDSMLRRLRVPRWLKVAFQTSIGLALCVSVFAGIRALTVYLSVVGILIVVAAFGLAMRHRWAQLLEAVVFALLATSSGTLAVLVVVRDPSDFLNWCKALNHGLFVLLFLSYCVQFADRWKDQGQDGDYSGSLVG